MKSNTTATLKLRAHSIRNLTAAELRVANGGHGTASVVNETCARTCGHSDLMPTRTRTK
jgi:hypothetical protein